MILHELTGTEDHPVYRKLEAANLERQYDFLRSIVTAALRIGRPVLSTQVIKSLNYHAITCLHSNAGEFRPCRVRVGEYEPPAHYRVRALMDDFVNEVNRNWESLDPVVMCAYVLWKLNHIHPFINGNGRTARVASYFVLCLKSGAWLPGTVLLPALIKANRPEYIEALRAADQSLAAGNLDISVLHELLTRLLNEQLAGQPDPNNQD